MPTDTSTPAAGNEPATTTVGRPDLPSPLRWQEGTGTPLDQPLSAALRAMEFVVPEANE